MAIGRRDLSRSPRRARTRTDERLATRTTREGVRAPIENDEPPILANGRSRLARQPWGEDRAHQRSRLGQERTESSARLRTASRSCRVPRVVRHEPVFARQPELERPHVLCVGRLTVRGGADPYEETVGETSGMV